MRDDDPGYAAARRLGTAEKWAAGVVLVVVAAVVLFLALFDWNMLRGPIGRILMPAAARLMGNLITDDDRDLIARTWRAAGRTVSSLRRDTPLWDSTAA